MKTFRRLSLLTVFVLLSPRPTFAGRAAFNIDASGQQLVVTNASDKPITPRLIIRGWTDGRAYPPRHAQGLRVNGKLLAPAMLTGATLIFEADGSAKWGYGSGFGPRVEWQPDDQRLRVFDNEKDAFDRWPPVNGEVGGIMPIVAGGNPNPWVYRVCLPDGMGMMKFSVSANAEQLRGGQRAIAVVQLCADQDGTQVAAQQRGTSFPMEFDMPGKPLPSTFFVRFTADEIKENATCGIYYIEMWAELDAKAIPRLTLEPGPNIITAEDDAASSHEWRIVLEGEGVQDTPPPARPVNDLPPHVKEHRSRFAEKTPPQGPPERAGQFFPLGIYAGHGNLHGDALQFVVDDMVDHNCNCVYMNNSSITNLAATLDLCERAGLKIIYQGGSSGSLYYQSKGYFKGSIEKEIEFNQQNFIPSARRHVPGFRGRWGILGWSLTEEIPPDVPERMKPCYGLMRELDPTHSCVLLHNNLTAAENDLAINRPEAVTTDIYAYAMNPMSSATSHVRAKDQILSYTARYRSACDKADVPLWFMGLCASAESEENCTWPPYGMAGGWPTITAADIRFQSWLAIASGARGLFFFAYHSPYPNGTACRDAWWRESPAWKAIGEFFGDVKPITKLLLNLQVAEDDPEALKSDDPKLLVRRLVPRGDETAVKGTYAVVVNIDCTEWRAANLSGTLVPQPPAMRDLKRNRPVPPDKPLMLAPGDGTLLQLP